MTEAVIERAQKRRKQAWEADDQNRLEMVDDLRFSALDQWPDEVKNDRKNRPMLTLDKTNQAIKRILGDMQENRPAIKVLPVDSGADKDTAEVMTGLIRQIEQQSQAVDVYMNAAKFQVKCGFGVWRITNDFTTHDVFDQDLMIKRVNNPLNWWFDPSAESPTKHDGQFVIGTDLIPKEVFKEKYGEEIPADFDQHYTGEGTELSWVTREGVVIAEYYEKVPVTREIVMLSTGDIVEIDKLTEEDRAILQQNGVEIVKTRKAKSHKIMYYKLTGFKILEEQELPYRYFPVIPVYGEVDNIEGESFVRGLVRAAKDPQRLYNYWNSAAAETIALQPKAPFVVTAKQIKNYKKYWDTANERNLPYLPYETDGTAPPPQRQAPPTLQAGLLQQAGVAQQDIKDAIGVHDAAVGAQSNEVSGIAIATRNLNAELTNSVYMFNLSIAIEHTGRVLIDMIPHFYDTERYIRITGEDGEETETVINRTVFTPSGKQIMNDLTRGKYDVRTAIGPSYQTRRQEGAQTLLEMIRVFPQLQQFAGDILAKNLDIPNAAELEARFRKMLPPGMVDEDDPAVLQAQQQQAAMQQQQLQLEVAKILSEIQKNESEAAENSANAEESMAGAILDLARASKEQAQTEQVQSETQINQQQAVLQALQQVLQGFNAGTLQ